MKKFVFKEVQNQFVAVLCANLMAVAHGGLMGWFSPAMLKLQTEASQVGQLNPEELSWLGSCSYIGGFVGTIVFMYITKWFGRKNTFLILAVPNFIFWLTIILAKKPLWLYVARVMGGFVGGGAYISIPLLVTEVADDNVPGILASILMVAVNVGVMMSYVSGALMDYDKSPIVMMFFPVGLFISFIFIPDTPMSLIYRKKSDAAVEKSLKYYLNIKDTSTENNKERFENALNGIRDLIEKKNNAPKFTVKDLLEKKALLGFGKSFAMVFISIFCGSPVLNNYSAKIFQDSGTSMEPLHCAVIMIVIQVFATVLATMVVDKFGRRILLIFSSLGTTIGFGMMGLFLYLSHIGKEMSSFDWGPVASISFTVFSAYIGLLPLVFVVIMEVLPSKVREFYATFCLSLVSLFMFIIVKCYPPVQAALQMYACMWIFAGVSFMATLFGIFILEETKGKDLTSI